MQKFGLKIALALCSSKIHFSNFLEIGWLKILYPQKISVKRKKLPEFPGK